MSVARAWYVQCDACGNAGDISTESAAGAKSLARAQGFIVKRGQWLCPWVCQDHGIDAVRVVRDDMTSALAAREDLAFIHGTIDFRNKEQK